MEILSTTYRTALLRAILQDPRFVADRRECITPDLFVTDEEKGVIGLVLSHFDKHGASPDEMVLEESLTKLGWDIEQVDAFLEEYTRTPPRQLHYLRDTVLEFAQKRRVESAIQRVAEMLDGTSMEDIRAVMLDAAFYADRTTSKGVIWDEEFKARLKKYREGRDISGAISTGLESLDEHMDGGLMPKELGCILAPPNTGKSALLINFGRAALLAGKNVLHYTLEMSAEMVTRRYDCSILGMTRKDLRTLQKTAWKKFQRLEALRGKLVIREAPMNSYSVAAMRSHMDLLANRDGWTPDIVIVDSAYLMRSSKGYDARRHELSSIYQGIHEVTRDFGVPLWTGHQTNRGGLEKDKKVIGLEDISECFEIGAISDVVISLNIGIDEKKSSCARIHFAKNRENVASLTHTVRYKAEIQRFEDFGDRL